MSNVIRAADRFPFGRALAPNAASLRAQAIIAGAVVRGGFPLEDMPV